MAKHVNHFTRAKAMFAAIAAAMSAAIAATMNFASFEGRQAALDKIGEYRSRGHGGKHMPKGRFLGWGYRQDRSKYQPHQGKQECARRLRQDEVLGEKDLKKLSAAHAEFESC